MTSQKLTLTQQLLFYRHILKTITLTQNLIFCRIFINLKTYYIFSTFFLLFFVHDEVKVRSSIIRAGVVVLVVEIFIFLCPVSMDILKMIYL